MLVYSMDHTGIRVRCILRWFSFTWKHVAWHTATPRGMAGVLSDMLTWREEHPKRELAVLGEYELPVLLNMSDDEMSPNMRLSLIVQALLDEVRVMSNGCHSLTFDCINSAIVDYGIRDGIEVLLEKIQQRELS